MINVFVAIGYVKITYSSAHDGGVSSSKNSLLLLGCIWGLSDLLSLVPNREEGTKLILEDVKLSGPLPSFFSPTVTLGIHARACILERFDLPVPFVIVPPRRNVPVPAPGDFELEALGRKLPCFGAPITPPVRTLAKPPVPPIGMGTMCSPVRALEGDR